MREIYAAVVHKVRKGLVRATVLGQITEIHKSINLLMQGRDIKTKEVKEYAGDTEKVRALKRQAEILDDGINHLKQAIKSLNHYKKLTTSK
jgi:cytidylate kinase